MEKPKVNLIQLDSYPILQQLRLEEALLRTSGENYILMNKGSSPAIVLGISQKPEEMVDLALAQSTNIPLIRRFSGGGTVVVDENTLFVTYIFNAKDVSIAPFPRPIAEWTTSLYQKAFPHLPFHLRENDYCLHDKKIGGNAQYLRKERWLHHTTFLFDYHPERMDLLLHPKKAPAYREGRSHEDFVTKFSSWLKTKEDFFLPLELSLQEALTITPISPPLERIAEPHRQSTELIILK